MFTYLMFWFALHVHLQCFLCIKKKTIETYDYGGSEFSKHTTDYHGSEFYEYTTIMEVTFINIRLWRGWIFWAYDYEVS